MRNTGLPIPQAKGRGEFAKLLNRQQGPEKVRDPFWLTQHIAEQFEDGWPIPREHESFTASIQALAKCTAELTKGELKFYPGDSETETCFAAYAQTAWDKHGGEHITVSRFNKLTRQPPEDWEGFGKSMLEMVMKLRIEDKPYDVSSIFDAFHLRARWAMADQWNVMIGGNNAERFPLIVASEFFANLPTSQQKQ